MPATAYSKTFAQELDLQQLLARLREVALTQVDPKGEVSEKERAWIRRDVICTCCSVDGALVVRAGQNETGRLVRQGHFRFRSLTGEDAHHRLCEFYGNETGQATGAEKVRFSSTAGSALTRAVGELVSRGIEREVFTSEQMQAMRRWYFEAKVPAASRWWRGPKSSPGWRPWPASRPRVRPTDRPMS